MQNQSASAGGPNAIVTFTDALALFLDHTYLRWRCSIATDSAACSAGCHTWLNSTGAPSTSVILCLHNAGCRATFAPLLDDATQE